MFTDDIKEIGEFIYVYHGNDTMFIYMHDDVVTTDAIGMSKKTYLKFRAYADEVFGLTGVAASPQDTNSPRPPHEGDKQ